MPSNTQTINKKILIPIIITITCVVIFAIIFGLSAGCILPNWFGLCKKPSIPAYKMTIDVELSTTEYQKIKSDPKKRTEITNQMRNKMARQLGFDEETAEKRIKIKLVEKFKSNKQRNNTTLREKYQGNTKISFQIEILTSESITGENKAKQINQLNNKVNQLDMKTITSESLTENEIQTDESSIEVKKTEVKTSENRNTRSTSKTNESKIEEKQLGKVNWDLITKYGELTIFDIDINVANIQYSVNGGNNWLPVDADNNLEPIILPESNNTSHKIFLPSGTYQIGQIRIRLYNNYNLQLFDQTISNDQEIIVKPNSCDDQNGGCDPNANCKQDADSNVICTCNPGYYGNGKKSEGGCDE